MRSLNIVSFPRKRESRAPARAGQVWMPAFAGMTVKFLRHPLIFEQLTRLDDRFRGTAQVQTQGLAFWLSLE